LLAYFGALKAGLVVLPLNPRFRKYPREIRFMAELPKGSSGKIVKAALRDG